MRGWEHRALDQRTEELTREQVEKLQVSLLRSLEVLYSIAALHQVNGTLDREQFGSFVRQALARQPEIQALSWNPRVPIDQRARWEAAAVSDGLAGFQFRERDGTGNFITARTRPEYVPVFFIEPLDRNALALGFDLDSDLSRRSSLEKARDSGRPIATVPLHLAQETGKQTGLLVLLPVYRGTVPTDVESRRERLAGYAVAVFKVADLVGTSFRELRTRGIEARLFDQTPDGELIYDGAAGTGAVLDAGRSTSLEFAGRRWSVVYSPTAELRATESHLQSRLALAGGLVFTLLATGYLVGIWRQTREVAAANAALQEEVRVRKNAEAEAASANAAKSDFLASMSHEIRTPLNAILGYTQLMQRDRGLAPEVHDSIRAISASGHHLLGLLNEILDLSKIEAGRMELSPTNFDLVALCGGLAMTFRPLCLARRVEFRTEFKGPLRVVVHGDEGKLRQVLINLLGNAVKFTRSGEVCLSFSQTAAGSWLFEVIDTGPGIPETEREEIFKPFHQGFGARDHGGTGLGLAIAQRQVDLLGGRLELQSSRGVGSRFFFTIPLPAGSSIGAEPSRVSSLAGGVRIRALVVDDRRENREVLKGMLTAIGCEVEVAADGEEACRAALADPPDIVFLDLLLPGLNGMETARRLMSESLDQRLKIVAHTASPLARLRDEALAAGCVDFLTKPFHAERIYECLRDHLGVDFEYQTPEQDPEALLPVESLRVNIPEELHARLSVAAELHSTTALKSCLQELRQLGPEGETLAEHIRHRMRSYDMDEILRLLARVGNSQGTGALPVGS
jgi:signal transduction histidine kinase/DNA-binding LytR/AlgR family response regulator